MEEPTFELVDGFVEEVTPRTGEDRKRYIPSEFLDEKKSIEGQIIDLNIAIQNQNDAITALNVKQEENLEKWQKCWDMGATMPDNYNEEMEYTALAPSTPEDGGGE